MKGHGEKLSRKQDLAVAALLSSPTIKAAAKVVGVGEVTLWRWLRNEQFQAAYRESRRQIVSHSVSLLQQASSDAVSALRAIVLDSDAPASSRVSAARTVLEIAIKGVELESMTARVAALETNAVERPAPANMTQINSVNDGQKVGLADLARLLYLSESASEPRALPGTQDHP